MGYSMLKGGFVDAWWVRDPAPSVSKVLGKARLTVGVALNLPSDLIFYQDRALLAPYELAGAQDAAPTTTPQLTSAPSPTMNNPL